MLILVAVFAIIITTINANIAANNANIHMNISIIGAGNIGGDAGSNKITKDQ